MVTRLQRHLAEHFGVWPTRQYDIARRSWHLHVAFERYVRGRREIPWHDQIAICELLGCGPDDILGDADSAEYDLT